MSWRAPIRGARDILGEAAEKVLFSGHRGKPVGEPFAPGRLPPYHSYSEAAGKRSYAEKLAYYSAGGQEFVSNLMVHNVFFKEGRAPVVELAYKAYDQQGLYQFLLKPSFGTVTAKALVVLLTRVNQSTGRGRRVMEEQRGAPQSPEVMRLFRMILPDKYGIHPADIESGQYFPNVRKQTEIPPKEVQTLMSGSVDTDMQSSVSHQAAAEGSSTRNHVAAIEPETTAPSEQLTIEERLKRYGCYPLLPAGRRAWNSVTGLQINVGLPGTMTWPPLGWDELTPSNKLWASQTVIALREMQRNDGFFPDGDLAEYLDKYKALILPGSKKMRREGPATMRLCQNSRDLFATLMHGISSSEMMSMGNAEVLEEFSNVISSLATRTNFKKCVGSDLASILETVPIADLAYDDDEDDASKKFT